MARAISRILIVLALLALSVAACERLPSLSTADPPAAPFAAPAAAPLASLPTAEPPTPALDAPAAPTAATAADAPPTGASATPGLTGSPLNAAPPDASTAHAATPASSVAPPNDGTPAAGTPRPPVATPLPPGAILGRVWHDLCAPPAGDAPPPPGCIPAPGGPLGTSARFQANGLLDPDEPGIAQILVTLGRGECPSTGLSAATTDDQGRYAFNRLPPATYCVSVNALDPQNRPILLPGDWTSPRPGDEAGIVRRTFTVQPGRAITDVNFGWDYQFLPPSPR